MEHEQFDRFARILGARLSRRGALVSGLLSGVLPAAALARTQPAAAGGDAEQCTANGQRCGKKHRPCSKCCSRQSIRGANGTRRCTCRPNNKSCRNSAQCCNGQCVSGVCLPECDVCASGCTYTEIQPAIDAAAPGATIQVCAGTYTGTLTIAANLTLRGVGGSADPARGTIVAGNLSGPAINVQSGTVSLLSLRITNGSPGLVGVGGGGVGVDDSANVTISDCTIADNTAFGGGGIACAGRLILRNTTIANNDGQFQGGGAAFFGDAVVTMSHVTFQNNSASLGLGGGCAISENATVNGSDITFSGNTTDQTAGDSGGAIVLADAANATFKSTTISGNRAYDGGGVHVDSSATGSITFDGNSRIRNNTAANTGGGIFNDASSSAVALHGALVTNNNPDNCAGSSPVTGCTN